MPFPNPDTQFKAGTIPNPKGRGKGVKNFATVYRELLELIDEDTGLDNQLAIATAVIKKAKEADLKAVEMIQDRTDGKVVQRVEQTNYDGEIQLRLDRSDEDSDQTAQRTTEDSGHEEQI